jgi:hypothetical protein
MLSEYGSFVEVLLQNQRSQIRGVTVIDTCVIWTIVRFIRDG